MNTKKKSLNRINQKLAFDVLKAFPKEFRAGLEFSSGIKVVGKVDKIVVSGMGGSSFPAVICKTYLEDSINKIPFEISRDYSIRTNLTEKSLVIIISYSGNTEEVISSLQDALNSNSKIIVITTGGRLLDIAIQNKIPYIKVIDALPSGQESLSTGYFIGCILGVMENSGLVHGAKEDVLGLEIFLKDIKVQRKAKSIANKIANSIPIVYTSSKYEESIARIAKIRFNQNSKCPAFYNVFPEMNHNELIGFDYRLADFHFLLVEDPDDNPRVNLRMKIFSDKLCKRMQSPSTIIKMIGRNSLQKVIGMLYLFEWLTLYLAEYYNVDPFQADLIDELKHELEMR